MTFDIGDPQAAGAGAGVGAGPAVGGGTTVAFSDDGKWVVFTTYPKRDEARRFRHQRRPIQNGVCSSSSIIT